MYLSVLSGSWMFDASVMTAACKAITWQTTESSFLCIIAFLR